MKIIRLILIFLLTVCFVSCGEEPGQKSPVTQEKKPVIEKEKAEKEIETLKRSKNPQDIFKVTRVIDGDTIVLENGEKVRLIGINCPPSRDGAELTERIKEIDLGHIFSESSMKDAMISRGITASTFTTLLCKGKEVRLEYDKTKRDRYGRLLAYVYLPDGKLLNEEIILHGHGFYYDKYPFRQEMMERFKKAEKIFSSKGKYNFGDDR